MPIFKDLMAFFKAMHTLPWTIRLWAILYPLPQVLGGLFFILTLPGFIVFSGRMLSFILASQVHKRAPFSKLMGPVGHANWLIITPYLLWELATQNLSAPLFWFVCYVVGTTLISAVIDVRVFVEYRKNRTCWL